MTGRAFYPLLDAASVIGTRRKKPGGRKRILVIRLDGIGDFILFTDALRGFRELYPREVALITLLGNEAWKELAAGLDSFDSAIFLNRARFLSDLPYRLGLIRRIRGMGFDLVLNPTFSREALLGDAVARFAANERIGWAGNTANISLTAKRVTDHWYTRLIGSDATPVMELLRNARFVRELGHTSFLASCPRLEVTAPWAREADNLLAAINVSRDYAIIVPGTGPPHQRRWPPEKYGRLARWLARDNGMVVLVCGGREDVLLGAEVSQASACEGVVDVTGKTSLGCLAGLIARAKVLIGSDTGAVHIASAVGTPCVTITGGAFEGRFLPYRWEAPLREGGPFPSECVPPLVVRSESPCACARWDCHREEVGREVFPCIAEVRTEAVVDAVKGLIGGVPPTAGPASHEEGRA